MFSTVAFEFTAVFIATVVLIWLFEPVARRMDWMDHPKGRKQHSHATPYHGGLAMYLALMVVAFAVSEPNAPLVGLAVASGILVVVGLLDDLFDIRWYVRILAQVLAALAIVVVGGVQIAQIGPVFGLGEMSLGVLSIPFTVFATVGLINALNMADGIDGLAGSLALVALLMLAGAAGYSGNLALLHGLVVIAGAVAAFLVFNLRRPGQRRARVFMGNAGSAFVGLLIAWAAFRLTQAPGHPVSPVLAPFLIAPPVIDCLVLITRRLAHGKSPFSADRGHMHHILMDAGFSVSTCVIVIVAASLLLGALAALAMLADVPQPLFVAAFIALTAGWYWLTARRARAVRALHALHDGLLKLPLLGRLFPALEGRPSL